MARLRRVRRLAAWPLLALLCIGASAAARTPEQAARDARMAIEQARYDEAQRIIDDALTRFESLENEAVWSLRVMRAQLLHVRGDYAKVGKALAKEPPAALRTSDPAVRRLIALANAAINLGEPKQAMRHLEQARAIAEKHQRALLGEIYAVMAMAAPTLRGAETYTQKATAFAKQNGDLRVEARAMATLSWLFLRAERYGDAIQWGERALAIAQSQKFERMIQQVVGNIASAYLALGEYEAAAELFTSAEASAARLKDDGARVSWLNQLGNLRVQKRDWAGAERYYADALRLARPKQHSDLGFILANLANVALETGRVADARRYNHEALQLKRKAGKSESVLRSLIIDARIAAASGDLANATRILNGVARDAKLATTRWEARGRLAEVFAKSNRIEDAIREFRSAIDTVRDARAAIKDSELQLSFFNITADIFSAYIDLLVSQGRIAAALTATEDIRIDALDDALNAQTPSRTIDPRAIAKQRNATILSYWLGPRNSYVWKITATEIRAARLESDAKITAAVSAYRRDLTGPRGSFESSRARGQQLYAMLGRPRGSRVLIIPDGSLHALNFETLVVPAPRPHYWIEDALISEASSIRVLEPRRAAKRQAAAMLLVGNPPQSDPAFPPLPRAADEMRSIARHFAATRVKVLEGPAATPRAYRSASPERFDYVHFVAHGTATRTRPLDSAVILARDATSSYKLLARDVVRQPLAARLVTISSCHGAGTRAYTGEGLVGLAWAFLRAGASSVIAALWEVNDSATPQLMDQLYKQTAAGVDPAAALREAKLSLLRSGSLYRLARYWAPFVYYE